MFWTPVFGMPKQTMSIPALGVLKTLAFLDANYLKPLVILKSSSLGEHSFCTVIYISWVSLGTSGRDEETNSNWTWNISSPHSLHQGYCHVCVVSVVRLVLYCGLGSFFIFHCLSVVSDTGEQLPIHSLKWCWNHVLTTCKAIVKAIVSGFVKCKWAGSLISIVFPAKNWHWILSEMLTKMTHGNINFRESMTTTLKFR